MQLPASLDKFTVYNDAVMYLFLSIMKTFIYLSFAIVLLQCVQFIVRQNHCDVCKDLTDIVGCLQLTEYHTPGKFVRDGRVWSRTAPLIDKPV